MSNKIKVIVGIIVLVVLAFMGYRSSQKELISNKINIGVITPLSGVRANAGEYTRNAIEIATQEINNDQNRKYKLNFLYEDTKYEPQVTVTAITKLIEVDKIHYIIGPNGSSEALAVAPIAEKNKTILITHGAQTDDLTSAGDYIFRIIHNTKQEAPIFADFVSKNMTGDTIHFIAMNTAAIDNYIKNFSPVFEKNGKKIGLIEKVDTKETDFKGPLIKIKAQKPTDIFILATPKQTGLILKQIGEMQMKANFYGIGAEGDEIPQIGGKVAEGYIYPYSYDKSMSGERVAQFYNQYVGKYGKNPDTLSANAYDAVYLISDCLEKVGDVVDAVKQCLYGTKDFEGAGGRFSIDQNGDAIKDIFIKTIKDGQFIKLQ